MEASRLRQENLGDLWTPVVERNYCPKRNLYEGNLIDIIKQITRRDCKDIAKLIIKVIPIIISFCIVLVVLSYVSIYLFIIHFITYICSSLEYTHIERVLMLRYMPVEEYYNY